MGKQDNIPYAFSSEVKEGKHFLTLSGVIRKKYWSEDKCIDAESVRNALDDVTDEIVIYLNSLGGDVFEGVEIFNYLKNHSSKITVEVTGTAASAATFITAGADKVIMNIGTTYMTHEASTYAWGNKGEIQKVLQQMETIDDSIISIYTEKTGQSAEQITQWMKDEKWFTADEAVRYGFADEVKRAEHQVSNENMKEMVNQAVALALAKHQDSPGKRKNPVKRSLVSKLRKEVE